MRRLILLFALLAPALPGQGEPMEKIPIIYSPHYNISIMGIEKLHPFDTQKYGHVYTYLMDHAGIHEDQFVSPQPATRDDLLTIHTEKYLRSLGRSITIAMIAELGSLALVPNPILQRKVLRPMKYATGGTVLGCRLALKHGWAINLSGGYHHAKADSGGGFCYFADIPIAVLKVWKRRPELNVLIVDCDAHQGNGVEDIFKDDPRIHIFDIYNEYIYPEDLEAKKYIDFDFPIPPYTDDGVYLSILEDELPAAIQSSHPGLIIYNAGTDIFEEDPLGALKITEGGIIKRDAIVFREALKNKVPILMLLSGGYTQKSANIIGRSIENLLKNVIK